MELAWGITWRMTAWGAVLGAVLGGLCGGTISSGNASFVGVGLAAGALLGFAPGILLGFADGVAMAVATYRAWVPMRDPAQYRSTMGRLCLGNCAVLLLLAMLTTFTTTGTVALYVLVPGAVAAGASWWASGRVVAWVMARLGPAPDMPARLEVFSAGYDRTPPSEEK